VVRKFPNVDLKSLSNIHPIRDEIVKSLSLYYYTFVDLLDFKAALWNRNRRNRNFLTSGTGTVTC
jgi:hypothetical protein